MLNEKEKLLAAHWLNELGSDYAQNSCNDVDVNLWNGWTLKERQEFVEEYCDYNGDINDFDPENLNLPDFAIIKFLAYKLMENKL